ncbi:MULTISPECIES: hypothetical protein [Cryobacterium]|uniref:hypothetical protein n=1 Tax=Cryobacterium TaxID=69578 RepID=UPI000B8848BE|nr:MULTISPECIES: hypothetical protein [Cryobacterium]
MRTFQVERDGETIQREEFVAKKIGHDLARTNYQITRTNRSAQGSEQDAAATQTAIVSETEAAHASSGW